MQALKGGGWGGVQELPEKLWIHRNPNNSKRMLNVYSVSTYASRQSPQPILLTCRVPFINMYFKSEWKTEDPDQIASSELSDLDLQFSKKG